MGDTVDRRADERSAARRRADERPAQRAILNWLGSRPWCRAWRSTTGVFVTPDGLRVVSVNLPGAADITGILRGGRRLEVEVKSATGRQSGKQRAFERMVTAMGGVYLVARTVEEVRVQLAAMGYGDG